MSKPAKQIHLAAHFPGVNNTTVWSHPEAGSHIEFSSFVHFAQTAERGKFDFLFLAEVGGDLAGFFVADRDAVDWAAVLDGLLQGIFQ